MAQFVFALEAVLRQRLHVEQECQRKLALHQQLMRDAEQALRELERSLRETSSDVRQNRMIGKIDLAYLAAYRRYIAAMQRKGNTAAQKMALIQRDIDTARIALTEASKQRKIMEKLRERQFLRWQEQKNRAEAAEMDDLAMRMAARRAMAGHEARSQ